MPILCSVKVQFVVSPWWAESSLVIDAPRFNKQIQTQICLNCHFPWFLFPSRNNQLYSFSKGSVEPIIDYGSPVTSFHLADSSVTFPPAKGAMQLNRHLHAKFKEKREIKRKPGQTAERNWIKNWHWQTNEARRIQGAYVIQRADQSCNQFGNALSWAGEWEAREVARQTNVCQQNALKQMEI